MQAASAPTLRRPLGRRAAPLFGTCQETVGEEAEMSPSGEG